MKTAFLVLAAACLVLSVVAAWAAAQENCVDCCQNCNIQKSIVVGRFTLGGMGKLQCGPGGGWCAISGGSPTVEIVNETVGQGGRKKTPGENLSGVIAMNLGRIIFFRDTGTGNGRITIDFLRKSKSLMSFNCKRMNVFISAGKSGAGPGWVLAAKTDMTRFIFFESEDGKSREFGLLDCFPIKYDPGNYSPSSIGNLENMTELETRLDFA
ncbi:MAG: hypothetical protein FJY76_00325 [Candidatus Aenigmarchaeota archaeon]|nr:hypothetical protein [Candidatus Aenigmarchaeota archaeon]